MFVTIVRRPEGEAPEWVRDAWIGLRLPLAAPQKRTWRGTGVLTGPRGSIGNIWALLTGRTFPVRGYAVRAKEAVDLLARQDLKAATWWRESAQHLMTRWGTFVFDEDACQVDAE